MVPCERSCHKEYILSHIKCFDQPPSATEDWACDKCIVETTPEHIAESTMHIASSSGHEESMSNESDLPLTPTPEVNKEHVSIFNELRSTRRRHPKSFMSAHLNINSVRYKFDEVKEVLTDGIVDLLVLSETKIDDTFRDDLFHVDGYTLQRRDRTRGGGGIMTFIRSDIPARRRHDLESDQLEGITYEVNIGQNKWAFVCMYKPPSLDDDLFNSECIKVLDKCTTIADKLLVIGDLNYDMLDKSKSKPLTDLSDLFDFHCLVKLPTCHVLHAKPSLVDVILTNAPKSCFGHLNFTTGISDWHNMVTICIKGVVEKGERSIYKYRSFRNYDRDMFVNDLSEIHVCDINHCDNVNMAYDGFVEDLTRIVDKHVPVKQRYQRKKLPCMNRELRKAIYTKHMLYSKYVKNRSSKTWEKYRVQRNYVEKLKCKSTSKYFIERCTGGHKADKFWPTIKPFLSKKGNSSSGKIILEENGSILSDSKEVCETFNSFYVNVAKEIGKDFVFEEDTHPSIVKILEHKENDVTFNFEHVNTDFVSKTINSFNVKKATGVDSLSVKILREGCDVLSQSITTLVNKSIDYGIFPDSLKKAQVCPIFKKGDCMDKKNYRPVSVLPIISKIFEKAISSQLTDFFEPIFNTFLCAFRRGYGCQTTLLRLIEDWKEALDKNMYVAAILMDLSKAFDCLPHNILLSKLAAYGLSGDSINLLGNYLANRQQQVKIGDSLSSWSDIQKGVPQGSILGPLLFNVFINDIFYFVDQSSLYNYADDNTLSFATPDFNKLISVLQAESNSLIDWFHFNCMKANPDKFQAIAIGKRTFEKSPVFELKGSIFIECEDVVKLLGIDIDYQLKFDKRPKGPHIVHLSTMCHLFEESAKADIFVY